MRNPAKLTVHVPDRSRKPAAPDAKSVILKDGPRVRRTATLFEIPDTKRGGIHHDSLKIECQKWENDGWSEVIDKRSVSLEPDEVETLTGFLNARHNNALPTDKGRYVMLPASNDTAALIERIGKLDGPAQSDALAMLLRQATENPGLLRDLVNRLSADDGYLEKAIVALNLAYYEKVVARLEWLIGTSAKEAEFQALLTEHPWLFGSEYSELLDRRCWTRDKQKDFVTRRTTDGRIEVIEIKTPLGGKDLFRYDPDHKNLYPSSELSKVVAQVESYLEGLDKDRDRIRADDQIDTAKVCAKIIIGRDGDESQQAALSRHNGHLHRIEIITFDGLLAIARRVLRYLQEPIGESVSKVIAPVSIYDLDDDIPL